MSAALFIASVLAMAAVRGFHVARASRVPIAASRETRRDRTLVALTGLGLVLPLAWLFGALSFANQPSAPWRLAAGAAVLALGLYVLHRSHRDLGTNWSNTLELKRDHALVTRGIYAQLRHPMYLALLLHGAGQALVVPNWLAGPAFLVPFAALVATRLRAEERMMRDAFGAAYDAYAAKTPRLIPRLFQSKKNDAVSRAVNGYAGVKSTSSQP
jgi:protein-S-isoprenylcysteine O-methyltransferase Ste14